MTFARRMSRVTVSPTLKVSAEEAEAYLDDALAKGVLKPAKDPVRRK